MKRIFHSGGSVVTGSDLADAVMQYAEALGNRHETDVVDIPVVVEDGSAGRAQILIGVNSQLMSVTSADGAVELTETDTIDAILGKMRAGAFPASMAWAGAPLGSPQFDEFDY